MAYIYRGRVPTTRDEEAVAGGYPSAGGGDGKTNVGEKESPEQGAVRSNSSSVWHRAVTICVDHSLFHYIQ